jgi:hypothetical protein
MYGTLLAEKLTNAIQKCQKKDYTKGSKITNLRNIYHPERRDKNGVQNRHWKNIKP